MRRTRDVTDRGKYEYNNNACENAYDNYSYSQGVLTASKPMPRYYKVSSVLIHELIQPNQESRTSAREGAIRGSTESLDVPCAAAFGYFARGMTKRIST